MGSPRTASAHRAHSSAMLLRFESQKHSPANLPARQTTGSSRTAADTARKSPAPLRDPAACSETRSEEHTSELQSRLHLVCRLLLEKKKKTKNRKIASQPVKKRET